MSGEREHKVRRIISLAFEGDQAPPALSVGVVSLVEFCQTSMPDPEKIRSAFKTIGFDVGSQKNADDAARMFALDSKVIASPVRNMRNEIYGAERNEAPVVLLLSEGDTDDGRVVLLTTIFRDAIEGDAVKAVTHVTKKQPFTGSSVRNADGKIVRRVFWDVEGVAGIRGMVVSGPENADALHLPRGITAFNRSTSTSAR